MYKVVFEFNHDEVDIVQVLMKEGEEWVLVKDKDLLAKIEAKFLSTRAKNPASRGYGQVIYTENLTYVTGSFESVK